MTTAARVAALALRPTLRAVPWLPLLGSATSAGVAVWLIDPTAGDVRALVALRVAAFLLAAGAGFVFDDPSAATLAASPTALAVRRLHRLVPVVAAWGVLWGAAVGVAAAVAPGAPVAVLTVEAAAMLALSLAVAAVVAPHVPEGRGGVVAGPALTLAVLGGLLAQQLYPRWATLFALSPGMPEWDAARSRWTFLLAAGVVVLAAASADPSRTRRLGA
jgi:hypothetical protein